VVTVVLVEYGVAGAASAVPIAEKVYTKLNDLGYFNVAPVAAAQPDAKKAGAAQARQIMLPQPQLPPKKNAAAPVVPDQALQKKPAAVKKAD